MSRVKLRLILVIWKAATFQIKWNLCKSKLCSALTKHFTVSTPAGWMWYYNMKHLPIIISFTFTWNQSYYSPLFQPQGFDHISQFYTESLSSKQSLTYNSLGNKCVNGVKEKIKWCGRTCFNKRSVAWCVYMCVMMSERCSCSLWALLSRVVPILTVVLVPLALILVILLPLLRILEKNITLQ